MELKIDPRLRDVLPPLSEEKKRDLEEDILEKGVLSPIIHWNGIIVDGHNRFEICERRGIPYETKGILFNSIEEAMFWICKNQMRQRDLNEYQRCMKALEYEEQVKAEAEQRMLSGKKIDPDQPVGQGGHERKSDYILGQFAGVSSETLRRSRFLCNEAPDDIQNALFAGVIAIGTAYKKLQAEKKREQAKEARRLAREAEKPNPLPQEKTLENPEGIVGGEPVYHNGELMPGVMRTPDGIVHASRPYADNPDSFPHVMDLVEKALGCFEGLIQRAMDALSAGMLTEENRKELVRAIRAASRIGMNRYKERMEEFEK